MILTRPCDECQQDYQAESKYLKRGQGKYCSRTCSGNANGKKMKVVHDPNTFCAFCGIEFYRSEARKTSKSGLYFCNSKHQSEAFKKTSGIPVFSGPQPDGERKKYSCELCGHIWKFPSKYSWCQDCIKKNRLERWLAGDISVTWVGKNRDPNDFVKKYLVKTRGKKCESCSFIQPEDFPGCIIQMDHTDGNYLNNSIDNLRLLCPTCHAMTETYGSKNRTGKGRAYRRKNYL